MLLQEFTTPAPFIFMTIQEYDLPLEICVNVSFDKVTSSVVFFTQSSSVLFDRSG